MGKVDIQINWTKEPYQTTFQTVELLEESNKNFQKLQLSLLLYDNLFGDLNTKILVAQFELFTRKSGLTEFRKAFIRSRLFSFAIDILRFLYFIDLLESPN